MTTTPPPLPSNSEGTAQIAEVSPLWVQPPWQEKTSRFFLQATMSLAAIYVAFRMIGLIDRLSGNPLASILAGCGVIALFAFIANFVHELGHFVCARLAGMFVIRVQVGHFEMRPTRRGWRIRWRKTTVKAGGFVMVVPDMARPLRPQMLMMMAGGILGNLAAALLAWLSSLVLPGAWSLACLLFAVFNSAYAIANLFPVRYSIPSDGMQLFAWLRRRISDDHPELAGMRLMSASLAGITADKVDEKDVLELESGLLSSRVLAAWVRLKAAQMRGDWSGAVAHGQTFETLCATASPDMAAQLADLRWMAQVESAFSQALADNSADAMRPLTLDKGADWLAPYIWPRTQALLAAFDGNDSLRDRLLAESARWAEDSVDGAVSISELRLRKAVESNMSFADFQRTR